jgi:hypothetical protein
MAPGETWEIAADADGVITEAAFTSEQEKEV